MELGAVFVGLAMLIGALTFVMKPLTGRSGYKNAQAVIRINPDEQRAATLSALRDLDFDFRTGKVSEEDYVGLRARLMTEAAKFVELEKEEDDRIEALIRARKAARTDEAVCSHCGEALEAGTRFCPRCGTVVGAVCPSCGENVKAGDLFCSSCGTKLEVRAEAAT